MENKILLICPTRQRGKNIDEFYKAFKENSSICDLVFSLDEDDYMNYPKFEDSNVFYEIGFKNGIVPAINYVAYKYAQNKQYKLIGMINDDHIIRTKDWDKIVYEKLKNEKIAIAYPNDLFTVENSGHLASDLYASAVFITPNIINILGYMANPMFYHRWVDHIWLDMGRKLGCLTYFENIIFEHMHPHANKNQYDEMYESYHTTEKAMKLIEIDHRIYNYYIEKCLDNDVEKIRKYFEIYG